MSMSVPPLLHLAASSLPTQTKTNVLGSGKVDVGMDLVVWSIGMGSSPTRCIRWRLEMTCLF